MKESDNKLERLGIGLILSIALLTFLSPLVRLRGPGGDLLGDGYHVRAGVTQLRSMLAVVDTVKLSEDRGASSRPRTEMPTVAKTSDVPFSLKISSLTPWLIYFGMACAALALLDLVSFRRAVALLSLAGGCFGALAVLHVILMGFDLQSWAMGLLNSGLLSGGGNAILVTRLLVVNSFQISPGLGLVMFTACLLLVPFLSVTRAVPRIRSVVRREPRIQISQPIRVRPLNANYPAETCTSVDLSRSGLCVESASNHYYVGMEVYVSRNAYPGNLPHPEEHGSVVRVQKQDAGKCRFAIGIFSTTRQEAPTATASEPLRQGQQEEVSSAEEITANSR